MKEMNECVGNKVEKMVKKMSVKNSAMTVRLGGLETESKGEVNSLGGLATTGGTIYMN